MLVCHFKLVADMVETGIREFMYDTDGTTFLKRGLVGFGVDRYWQVRVHDRTNGLVANHMFQEN